MRFQLLRLVIWPKDPQFAPRVVEFTPGVVNVITGGSRTGKSAIIPIIDYCLASSDCFVPIDTIRDNALWYGVVVQTDSEEMLLARCVSTGNKVSNAFFVLRASAVSIPPAIGEANETLDGVKNILNTISSVPYFSLEGDENQRGYQARLGFRDLMALVFQSQDIVANQNILFYKTHAHVHRERLRNWFPFILGAETIEILQARQRLQEVEQKLKRLSRELEKAKAHSLSWMNNMVGHLRVAVEYGLLDEKITETATSEDLLLAAKRILENVPDHTNTDADDVRGSNDEFARLETEENGLSTEIALVKKRLSTLDRLKGSFTDYGNAVRRRVDRLHISQRLEDISKGSNSCPACGSAEHPRSKSELRKIGNAFRAYEGESKLLEEIPTSFSREEDGLKVELGSLLEAKKAHQGRYDILLARDTKAQEEFQRRKNMFFFLGHLKASLETFESLGDGGEFHDEVSLLQSESERLNRIVDRGGVTKRLKAATVRIAQRMLYHLKTLDVEGKYREVAPRFDVEDLNISVLSTDDSWHYLAEVGSASNWVSFHLALFCSLQEHFIGQAVSSVPSFVIFDQPSQVYFPKVRRGREEEEDDHKYEDEDVQAVKKMFRTLADSIIGTDGAWQAIVLDHADGSIYSDIDGVHEVEEWRRGEKLIPEEWYEEKK